GLEDVNLAAIRARKLNVVVDGCASVGGVTAPRLLRQLNATVVELDCVPNGIFTRELEPLPEHLGHLGRAVREAGADFGVALDPDADRAAFVDAAGVALGEEFTVALATATVLERRTGPVVTNFSTSRMMDAVCARAHVPLHRTLVGEAHVVAAMREHRAVVGGEGNGGVILPAAHYGRDGLVAIALVAQAMRSGESLRALADRLPRLVMRKLKASRSQEPWERAAGRLRAAFPGFATESADGLRFSQGDDWVHVRPSGTEPSRAARWQGRLRRSHVRNRGLRGASPMSPHSRRGTQAPRVSRLRLRRHRDPGERIPRHLEGRGQDPHPRVAAQRPHRAGDDRDRAHALGHAR
ncbi:MAG: hypothetical protein E6K80_10110, partial [Candidatus Eisenbacteria bacterium]